MIKQRINGFLFKEVNIAPLITFRIVFSFLILFSTLRFLFNGWVDSIYIQPKFHFTFYGFEWVKVLPGNWMYLPFILLVFSSIGMMIGWKYKLNAIVAFLSFLYVELVDKSTYLNHYYFVSLVLFLLIFVPANANFSFDSRKKASKTVSQWTIFIFQFQLGVVYFYAGLAKINSDWLFEAQPLRMWLQAYRDTPVIGFLFTKTWLAFAFSWFGCIYDLSIPFLLSFKKTRALAYFFVVVFHIITWILFPIGVFPWVMIFSTLIFFSAEFHQGIYQRLGIVLKNNLKFRKRKRTVLTGFLIIYISFQLLFPFRYLLYPGNLFWTEEGFRFSWRVMLMEKKGYATFYIYDSTEQSNQLKVNSSLKGRIEIDNSKYLTSQQIDQMSRQPDMILEFAHFLKKEFSDTIIETGISSSKTKIHIKNPKVGADVFVTLNGRMHQQLISADTDLGNIKNSLAHKKWILPFHE